MGAAFEADEMASADDLVAQLAAGGALTFEPDIEEDALLPGAASAVSAEVAAAMDLVNSAH
jgi:hypothetical protein